jgi:aminopeptidase
MHDARFDKLAALLVNYSTNLKRDEKVLIETFDAPDEMTIALIRAVRKAKAVPFVQIQRAQVSRELALEIDERQLNLTATHELARMKKMDAYIAIRGSNNISELTDVPIDKMKLVAKKLRPLQDHRVQKTKWVVLRWPTPSMAQLAGMSTEAFEDFFFKVCTLDYNRLQPGMKALKALMEKTDKVQIKGPGTDLRFSIKGYTRRSSAAAIATFPTAKFSAARSGIPFRGTSPSTRRAFIRARPSTTSGSIFATGKSWRPQATSPKNSTRCSIPMRARATSGSSR